MLWMRGFCGCVWFVLFCGCLDVGLCCGVCLVCVWILWMGGMWSIVDV